MQAHCTALLKFKTLKSAIQYEPVYSLAMVDWFLK